MLSGSTMMVHDFTGRTLVRQFRVQIPNNRNATTATLLQDGSRFAVGDDAGRVTVWSATNQTPLATIDTGTRNPVTRVALTDDGHHVAAPTPTGIGVWAVSGGQLMAQVDVDDQLVFRFLSNDRLVTAGRDGVVRVWTLNGREELSLFGHVGRVTGLGVSPDGRTLVSGSATGEVKFWDVRTGQELLGLRRHSTPVTVIEFAPGGRVLVTGGEGQLAVWDARQE
jgi:WD40 repeat protein